MSRAYLQGKRLTTKQLVAHLVKNNNLHETVVWKSINIQQKKKITLTHLNRKEGRVSLLNSLCKFFNRLEEMHAMT